MKLRSLTQFSLPFVLATGAFLMGACSPEEETAGDGNTGAGGDPNVPPGTGGDTGGATGGASGDTGGAPVGTGGESPAAGGAPDGTGGNATGGDGNGTGGDSNGTGGDGTGGDGTGGDGNGAGGSGMTECTTPEEEAFSFFATSHDALIRESGNPDGFGGDLGGLAGADAICQSIAEFSSPCQSNKVWRAFLSTSTEDAIDRIGTGPWHDRLGRLLANNIDELLDPSGRPTNAHDEIKDDFPNEDGVPNQYPDGEHVDNHQFITGSGLDGRLYAVNDGAGSMCNDEFSVAAATCNDWTTNGDVGCPRVGHSWPRQGSGIHWISVWNESGCAPGGVLSDSAGFPMPGDRKIGSYGGYGGFYCFAVTGQ